MAHKFSSCTTLCINGGLLDLGVRVRASSQLGHGVPSGFIKGQPRIYLHKNSPIRREIRLVSHKNLFFFPRGGHNRLGRMMLIIPSSSASPNSNGSEDKAPEKAKAPFGYTRKDVLLIGLGVTVVGYGLKSALEAGNAVQLIVVLGLTVGWIFTYIFRVSNKEMTYAQQLRDYENKVMEKRFESLSEAELAALLEQVEEEKRRLASGEQVD